MSKRGKILKSIKINIDGAVESLGQIKDLSDEDCLWIFKKLEKHINSVEKLMDADMEFRQRLSNLDKKSNDLPTIDHDDELPF